MGELRTQTTYITSLVLYGSPTPSHLVSGGGDGTVYVWKIDTLERVHKITGHTGEVTGLAMHPSGMKPLKYTPPLFLTHRQVVLHSQLAVIRKFVCGTCSQASWSVVVLCQLYQRLFVFQPLALSMLSQQKRKVCESTCGCIPACLTTIF
jgi:hypothetical protein